MVCRVMAARVKSTIDPALLTWARETAGFTPAEAAHMTGSCGRHDNYGFALSAQPGESQRRPATNSSSRLIVCIGLPALRAPRCLCPDGRTIRTGQPVDLVHQHNVDSARPDIRQELLQSGPLERGAGECAVVVAAGDQPPAFVRLALYICLAGLALGIERVEGKLEIVLGR